jgi:tetratricopeptide (TPR) repeat protein
MRVIAGLAGILLAISGSSAFATEDLLRQEMDGGWRGGDATMGCVHHGEIYIVEIDNNEARISVDGAPEHPLEVTFKPYGFVMTAGTSNEGVTYTASFEGTALSFRTFGPGLLVFGPRENTNCLTDARSSALLRANDRVKKLYQQGRYAEALPYATKASKLSEEELGPHHPTTAVMVNNLAELNRVHGNYAQAETLFQRSLAIAKEAFGPEHQEVAVTLSNLALLYHGQGDYASAEPLYQRSIRIFEKTLGPDHLSLATSFELYAALLRATGRAGKAETMEGRAKAIRAKHE